MLQQRKQTVRKPWDYDNPRAPFYSEATLPPSPSPISRTKDSSTRRIKDGRESGLCQHSQDSLLSPEETTSFHSQHTIFNLLREGV